MHKDEYIKQVRLAGHLSAAAEFLAACEEAEEIRRVWLIAARMISAAPELIVACEKAEKWISNHGGDPNDDPKLAEVLKILRHAIQSAYFDAPTVEQIYDPSD